MKSTWYKKQYGECDAFLWLVIYDSLVFTLETSGLRFCIKTSAQTHVLRCSLCTCLWKPNERLLASTCVFSSRMSPVYLCNLRPGLWVGVRLWEHLNGFSRGQHYGCHVWEAFPMCVTPHCPHPRPHRAAWQPTAPAAPCTHLHRTKMDGNVSI